MGRKLEISSSVVNPSKRLKRDLAPGSCLTNKPGVLQTSPEIIKEGWLLERDALNEKRRKRFFVLLSDGSFLGFEAQPERDRYSTGSHFSVKGCQVMTEDKTLGATFIIRDLRAEVVERVFSVDSQEERADWIEAIQRVVQGLRQGNEKTLGKQVPGPETTQKSSDRPSQITMDDFQLIRVLGEGSFAQVVMCRDKSTNQVLAMKILKREVYLTDKTAFGHMLTECRVLRTTRHPFLTALKYSFPVADRLCFAMEYVIGGDLYFHLAEADFFSEEKSRFYGAEITLALEYLHQRGIVHRDLKLGNILLAGDGHIKLADFGLCKENMYYGDTAETYCGTLEYSAPEIVEKTPYGRAVDWWALGVIMYQMLCGGYPFYSSDKESLRDMIMGDDVELPPDLSPYAESLLEGLLTKNPKVRLGGGVLGADEVKGHGFFAGVQWDRLLAKEIPPPFVPETSSATDTRYFDAEFTEQPVVLRN